MAETRVMPHNIDAEKSVLGAIFVDPTCLASVADKLTVEDFYETKNKNIYRALLNLLESDSKIDYTTVSTELASLKVMSQVGVDYLVEVTDYLPTITNLDSYIELVKDESLKRSMIQVSSEIYSKGFDPAITASDYVDDAEEAIFTLIRKRRAGEFLTLSEVLKEVRNKAEIKRSDSTVTGIDTGFAKLNYATAGFQPEEFIILAARPSVGKSALAMNLALQVAKFNKQGKAGVAIFSLEMSNEQLVSRMLSCESLVSNRRIKTGNLTSNEWDDINAATNSLNQLRIFFDDSSDVKVKDIRAKCRKLRQEGRLDFVIIDYLQLINESSSRGNRQEGVAEISRSLKQMARELKIPVLALSQLSRDLEKREDKTPVLADLRESGSIEQDADIVLFLYAPRDETNTLIGEDIIEVKIAKNRQGSLGDFRLKFNKDQSKFYAITDREE
ncbi:MAG: replicative DNA helicase [Acholeplasmataceae bacterium]|nr:replicative DNA helicase [Acholeplasmataceae bacterium]